MSRQHSFFRQIVGAMIFITCLLITGQRAVGQAYCTDCTQPDQVWRAQLFMGPGTTPLPVDVTVCNQDFCAPVAYTHPCLPGQQAINARTVIKKICPVGWSGAGTPAALMLTKVITSLGVCCSGQTYFPACPGTTDFFWLVSYAKCWHYDALANCWVPCPDSPCCANLIQYKPNFPTTGECSTIPLGGCEEPGLCPTPHPPTTCDNVETVSCGIVPEQQCP